MSKIIRLSPKQNKDKNAPLTKGDLKSLIEFMDELAERTEQLEKLQAKMARILANIKKLKA